MIEARVTKSVDQVVRFYDRKVELHGSGAFRIDSAFAYDWLKRVGIGVGTKVLDAGCGTGSWIGSILRLGAIPVGVDVSGRMVTECCFAFPNVSFRRCDMQELPFEANSFDVVICCGSMEHTIDVCKARDELYRVSKWRVAVILPMFFHRCWRYLEEEELPNTERFGNPEDWHSLLDNGDVTFVDEWVIAGEHPDYCAVMEKAEKEKT